NKFNGEIFFKDIGFIADTVIIDPEYWLITRNNISQKVIDNTTGQNAVEVFPSPFSNLVNVYLKNFNFNQAYLKMFDAGGRLIYKKHITSTGSSFTEINTQPFARGLYILKIEAGNSFKFAKKILKQ
ncbi:MAG: T9SS type A sorting domain-containing protein, partial [Ginsengibacter sp.]